MKIVLDTDVLVAGLISPTGASRALLSMVLARRNVLPVVSVPLFMEYEAVLTRPEILLRTRLSQSQTIAFLDELAAVVVHTKIHFAWRPQLIDPADEMVLEAAINGRVHALVTFNHRHMQPCFMFGIQLVSPGQMLFQLKNEEQKNG